MLVLCSVSGSLHMQTGALVRVSTPCNSASGCRNPGMRRSKSNRASRRAAVICGG